MDFLEENKLIYKRHFGFRSKMSTEKSAILLMVDVRKNVGEGKLAGTVFIDLSKAFDAVSHSKLLSKLPSYGVHARELTWFTDYLPIPTTSRCEM